MIRISVDYKKVKLTNTGLSDVYFHYLDIDNNRYFPEKDGHFIRQVHVYNKKFNVYTSWDCSDGDTFHIVMDSLGFVTYEYNHCKLYGVHDNRTKFVKAVSTDKNFYKIIRNIDHKG